MASSRTVPHLKNNNGSWTYRRRVPERHHDTLGFKVWNKPCGKVSYPEAVAKVLKWTNEHDDLIARLDRPEVAAQVREVTETDKVAFIAQNMMDAIELTKNDPLALSRGHDQDGNPVLFGDEPFIPWEFAKEMITDVDKNSDPVRRLVLYRMLKDTHFGPHVDVPTDLDQRDQYDLVKRMLERRIAELDGDPNKISVVSEKSFDFARIKTQVRKKYRRSIQQLIDHAGDIPLPHLTGTKLREFREAKTGSMKASSVQSVFTPIRTMMKFAVENEIIENNPMPNVSMPRETRSVNSIKWKPFSPEEAQRIFEAMDRLWGKPVRNMSEQRRKAIWWAVRVQAFTAMRPKEVVDLKPQNVNERWIKVEDSKTKESDRTIPLHPEIAGFVEFLHSGGFETFDTQEKDKVQTVRHNFQRLVQDFMDPPIIHPKKVLYSWRSTFSNVDCH
ncbi:tyrosine-type recombinase/integrase [Phaeobacter inhibens]|uniref:tyrosine-type recombinase/integrase n=1 Tax=Phaeobacter inhibens TaxID=221822 RepID=UPI0024B8358E|nr:phage integrase SAM-like domain-containing protein [Phaeobacter inhibens]WHP69586.1 phage integrase SAM-like domain-containing protein [Phaeobacter inhibens]